MQKKEQKRVFTHLEMFEPQIRLHNRRAALAHPALVAAGRLPRVHIPSRRWSSWLGPGRRVPRHAVYPNHIPVNRDSMTPPPISESAK